MTPRCSHADASVDNEDNLATMSHISKKIMSLQINEVGGYHDNQGL